MRKEYLTIGVVGIVLVLLMSGCMEQKLDKEKVMGAMDKVENFAADIKITTSMYGQTMTIPMTMKVDLKNKKEYVSMEMMGVNTEMYVVGNTTYSNTFGKWTKKEGKETGQVFGTDASASETLKCWKEMKVVGEEKIDGCDCYKIDVQIDQECWKKQNKDTMFGANGSGEKVSIENVTAYVDKNTNLVKKEIYVIKITAEVMNANMTMSMGMEMRFKDYGNTTIDLPEGAKNAEVEKGFELSQRSE